jgi:hypothetical protein
MFDLARDLARALDSNYSVFPNGWPLRSFPIVINAILVLSYGRH